jgi:hypothetical protein
LLTELGRDHLFRAAIVDESAPLYLAAHAEDVGVTGANRMAPSPLRIVRQR